MKLDSEELQVSGGATEQCSQGARSGEAGDWRHNFLRAPYLLEELALNGKSDSQRIIEAETEQ